MKLDFENYNETARTLLLEMYFQKLSLSKVSETFLPYFLLHGNPIYTFRINLNFKFHRRSQAMKDPCHINYPERVNETGIMQTLQLKFFIFHEK